MITCASDILPGPAVIISNAPPNMTRSIAYPPFPVMLEASFTTNIAPSIIIAITDADSLVNTPMISNIPEINSASAIGICISTGMPRLPSIPANPGLNFPDPCTMKTTPIAALMPQFVISFSFVLWMLDSVNTKFCFLPYKIFYPYFESKKEKALYYAVKSFELCLCTCPEQQLWELLLMAA